MSTQVIGDTTGNIESTVVSATRQRGAWAEVQIRLFSGKSDWYDDVPASESTLPTSPVNWQTVFGTYLKLASVKSSQRLDGIWQLDCTYKAPSSDWATTGDTAKASSVTLRELPVTEKEKADLAAGKNVRTKLGAQVRYSETVIDASFTWSQANIIGQCGKIASPGSLPGATPNAWLQIEKTVNKSADGVTKIKQGWQYDENKWDTNLYS